MCIHPHTVSFIALKLLNQTPFRLKVLALQAMAPSTWCSVLECFNFIKTWSLMYSLFYDSCGEFYSLFSCQILLWSLNKDYEMDGTCGTHGTISTAYKMLTRKHEGRRDFGRPSALLGVHLHNGIFCVLRKPLIRFYLYLVWNIL